MRRRYKKKIAKVFFRLRRQSLQGSRWKIEEFSKIFYRPLRSVWRGRPYLPYYEYESYEQWLERISLDLLRLSNSQRRSGEQNDWLIRLSVGDGHDALSYVFKGISKDVKKLLRGRHRFGVETRSPFHASSHFSLLSEREGKDPEKEERFLTGEKE